MKEGKLELLVCHQLFQQCCNFDNFLFFFFFPELFVVVVLVLFLFCKLISFIFSGVVIR